MIQTGITAGHRMCLIVCSINMAAMVDTTGEYLVFVLLFDDVGDVIIPL